MAVSFGYRLHALAVAFFERRIGRYLTFVSAEPHRSAGVLIADLVFHYVYDFVLRRGIELARGRVGKAEHVARELDDGYLHAEADAEVRLVMLAAVLGGSYHALDAAVAETAGHYHAVRCAEYIADRAVGYLFRVYPF